MTDVVITPITSGYNLSRLNTNFSELARVINDETLHTVGGNNVMSQELDMNGYAILNTSFDINDPGSLITVGEADARYYNVSGDQLTGPMDVNSQTISNLKIAVGPTEAVRNSQLTDEIDARASADANLQDQLSGSVPLEASAFSPISWHDQSIDNSVVIPDNKNAWSFGPTMSIDIGQVVTVGEGSFWTIANGEVV